MDYSKLKNKRFLFKFGSYNNVGGAETKAIELADALKNIGADVFFLANGGNGDLKQILKDKGYTLYTLPYKPHLPKIKKAFQLVKQILFLRKLKPDFILPWSSDNCKSVLPFWRFTGAKYAWWNMQDEGRGLYKTKNENKLLLEASDIISNSLIGKEFLEQNYELNNRGVILYNNPTPIPDVSNLSFSWRQELGIGNDVLVVSMFANITAWKDHKTLFKAWQQVQNYFELKQQKVMLLLAGACRETTPDLKILGFDLKIAHTVQFLGSIQKVNELIVASDLVVHSSNTEGCPNAVCEAMALGKAVLATDVLGCREALSAQFEQYCLSKPNTPNDLADKLIFLFENIDIVNKIGVYNKERIVKEYTLEGMLDVMLPRFVKALEG